MANSSYQLGKILNLERWQKLQDSIATVTGLAIVTVDYKGTPITAHSSRCAFCDYVRNHPDLHRLCQKCDSRGGLEAVRMSQPYIYICHCNIIDIAIPIITDDQYIGAVMAGEIKLSDSPDEHTLEKITNTSSEHLLDDPEIRKLYDAIPVTSYRQLSASVQMLSDLCNYLVEEATNKNVILEMYKKISASEHLLADSTGLSPNMVKNIRYELSNALTSAYLDPSWNLVSCHNKTLQPAFDYLYEHRNTMLSQKDAAALCHISPGHFSRLFLKETKENYSVFCVRQKIEWAKQLLSKTDLPIAQISDEFGFNEPSYFIKVFRKYEGITPAHFRKHSKSLPQPR